LIIFVVKSHSVVEFINVGAAVLFLAMQCFLELTMQIFPIQEIELFKKQPIDIMLSFGKSDSHSID